MFSTGSDETVAYGVIGKVAVEVKAIEGSTETGPADARKQA